MITKDISKAAKNLAGTISKNSPVLLTGLAVTGLITTVILAVQATPKALQLIEEDQTPLEKVKATWKCYIPAAAVGTVTMGCIIGAHRITARRTAALATAYSLTETAFKEYQSKVVETIGRNKEQNVRDEIDADRLKNDPVDGKEIFLTGKGDVLCYDSLSGRYFKSDIEQIRRVVNKLSRDLMSESKIALNDLYFALGLPSIKLGDQLGWDIDDGLIEVMFSSQLTEDGNPCLVITCDVVPID